MNFRLKAAFVGMLALTALAGCGGGGGIEGTGGTGTGTLRLAITDAPACGYDAVHITIEKVRVHQAAGADDGDSGWSELVLTPARRVDLLTLTNGVLEPLGQTALPAGKYTQMRLVLASNGHAFAPPNSVTPTGGSETALTTPSAQQSGIKMNIDIDIAADQVGDFAIDFDACKSIVRRGNSGQFNLKPVVSVIPILSDAGLRVVGYVDRSIANTATQVSAQSGGMPVKATTPDASGKFVLYPVPVGSYDLVVTAPGHVSAVMLGVPVLATAITQVNTQTVPIALPTATMRAVTGLVTPSTATVRALQSLTGGPTIEVAWAPVDVETAAFAFGLPIEAPLKTAYVAEPGSLAFVADPAAAGRYTVEAASSGATKSLAIDVAAPVRPLLFTFP